MGLIVSNPCLLAKKFHPILSPNGPGTAPKLFSPLYVISFFLELKNQKFHRDPALDIFFGKSHNVRSSRLNRILNHTVGTHSRRYGPVRTNGQIHPRQTFHPQLGTFFEANHELRPSGKRSKMKFCFSYVKLSGPSRMKHDYYQSNDSTKLIRKHQIKNEEKNRKPNN